MKLPNSIVLYTYYDVNGILSEEAKYYLISLTALFEETWLICNGGLVPNDDLSHFLKINNIHLFERENRGFDFGGWKDAILTIGEDKIKKIKTLCLCNSSCFGPVYPFNTIFDKAEEYNYDVWGLTVHPEVHNRFPWHIQSYFLVFSSKVLQSSFFFEYWKKLIAPLSWQEAVTNIEVKLTSSFKQRGFKCGAIFENENLSSNEPNITLLYAPELLEMGSPLVKKKLFTEKNEYFRSKGNFQEANRTFNLIKEYNPKLAELIDAYLINTLPPSRYRQALHNILIEGDFYLPKNKSFKFDSIGVVCFVFFPDLLDLTLNYLRNIPDYIQICIVSSDQDLLSEYRNALTNKKNCIFRVTENRGRNEAAYFVTCLDLLQKWELFCLVHDKKTSHAPHPHMGKCWMEHCFNNLLGSNSEIEKIIQCFTNDPKLGMIIPPPPLFAVWTKLILTDPWAGNRDLSKSFLASLEINEELDPDPLAPFGGMFWARREALAPLLDLNLSIENFPMEPLPIDGSFLHALERIYPQIVKSQCFKTSWFLTQKEAASYLNNIYECLKDEINRPMLTTCQEIRLKEFIKLKLKKYPYLYQSGSKLYRSLKAIKGALFSKNKLNLQTNLEKVITPLVFSKSNLRYKEFVLILPCINSKSFSGGPNTALLFASEFARRGWKIRCLSLQPDICDNLTLRNHLSTLFLNKDQYLAKNFSCEKYDSNIKLHKESIVCATAVPTCEPALQLFNRNCLNIRSPLYLIQDFEAGFYPWGDYYAKSLSTYFENFIPIFNEKLLKDFFLAQPELKNSIAKIDSLCFEPSINIEVDKIKKISERKKKIFLFYARRNAPRNLFETGLEAIKIAVKNNILRADKWEIYMFGDTSLQDIPLGKGLTLKNLPWLSYADYIALLQRCSCGLSLMLSPHTSYLPLELAKCSVPVITNSFSNKTELELNKISSFIICAQPTPLSISKAIAKATTIDTSNLMKPILPNSWEDSFKDIVEKISCLTKDRT